MPSMQLSAGTTTVGPNAITFARDQAAENVAGIPSLLEWVRWDTALQSGSNGSTWRFRGYKQMLIGRGYGSGKAPTVNIGPSSNRPAIYLGQTGGAQASNGSAVIDSQNVPLINSASFTIAGVVASDGDATNYGRGAIVANNQTGNNYFAIIVGAGASKGWLTVYHDQSTTFAVRNATDRSGTTFTFVYDYDAVAQVSTLYVNGVVVAVASGITTLITPGLARIGGTSTANSNIGLYMKIGELMFFNQSLTHPSRETQLGYVHGWYASRYL